MWDVEEIFVGVGAFLVLALAALMVVWMGKMTYDTVFPGDIYELPRNEWTCTATTTRQVATTVMVGKVPVTQLHDVTSCTRYEKTND